MANTEGQDPNIRRLEREAERTRAELVNTVDELRTRVTDTVSPDHLKQDVKQYVSRTSQDVFSNLKQKAYDNPLQAVAIGAGLAYPVWRMVRSVPMPVLLLGAGMALAGRGQSALRRSGNGSWRESGSTSDRYGYGDEYRTQPQFQPSAGQDGGAGYQRDFQSSARPDELYSEQFGSSTRQDWRSGSQRQYGTWQDQSRTHGARGQLSDMASRVSSAVSSGLSAVTSRVEHMFSGSDGTGTRRLSTNAGFGSGSSGYGSSGYGTSGYGSSGYGSDGGSAGTNVGSGYRQRWDQNALVETAQRHRYLVGGGTLLLGAMLARSLTGRRNAQSRRTGRHRY